MKKLPYLLFILFFISSCYSTYDDVDRARPENLIDRDKIVLIIADVEIVESSLRQKQNVGHEVKDVKETYYHSIFSEHGVSRAQFDSSMVYYKQDPEVMNEIYEDVITRLSLMQSEIELEDN